MDEFLRALAPVKRRIRRNRMLRGAAFGLAAGMAGALYGLNFNMISADKFNFNTSILVLVFVVLGGLGNMLGSIIAATVLYILPEALRGLADYRMLMYAVVLIIVMLATNNPTVRNLFLKILPKRKQKKEGA